MKSSVIRLADFKSYLRNFKIDFMLDEEKFNEELKTILVKNKKSEYVESIERGDIVTVNLKSDNVKFNKDNLKIVVGSYFFSKELEDKLIGLNLNDNIVMIVDGCNIEVKITTITRNILPTLTDELIKKENIPGIETIDNYKKMYYENAKEKYLDDEVINLSIKIFDELVKNSVFAISDEDVQQMLDEMLGWYRKTAENEGTTLEKMTSEEFRKISNYSSLEELINKEKEVSETLVKICVVSSKVLNIDITNMEANRNNVLKLQIAFTNHLKKELGIYRSEKYGN